MKGCVKDQVSVSLGCEEQICSIRIKSSHSLELDFGVFV